MWVVLGVVVSRNGEELLIDVTQELAVGDGVGFESPEGIGESIGFSIEGIRTIERSARGMRQAIRTRVAVPTGWILRRTSHASLLAGARASFASLPSDVARRRHRLDVRVFGSAGAPLKIIATSGDASTTVRGAISLVPATKRALDQAQLREQLRDYTDRFDVALER